MTPEDDARARIEESRRRIDEIDIRLAALLNERARAVETIGRAKQVLALRVYEPKREDQVYENVARHNGGPLSNEALRRIYERVIDEMRTLQRDRMTENTES
jgi:chorismate mutase